MPKRKRTKAEAKKRIASIDLIPDDSELYSPRTRALMDSARMVQAGAKFGASRLVSLDPLNRLADEVIVVPVPMIAIPAHEAYRLSSDPTMQIYIRAGETIMPTGGNVDDVQEAVAEAESVSIEPKKKRKSNKRAKAYGKAFKSLAPKYKLKSGKWKKNGFKSCVRAAHAKVKKEMK